VSAAVMRMSPIRRWEDAYVVIWRAYEEASPVDHPTLLSTRAIRFHRSHKRYQSRQIIMSRRIAGRAFSLSKTIPRRAA